MKNLKRYFLSGLLVTLPVFLTLYLLFAIFRFIDGIWGRLINIYLKKYFGFAIPGIGIILSIITVLCIGFLATHFIGKSFFKSIEARLLKLPIIRQVYPAITQIVGSLISKDGHAFKKVALVEYPSKGIWSVGFITNDGFEEAERKTGQELVHVLIGTTPTPLSGFLILVPKDQVKVLDISIEEGIKLIVSGGIVKPKKI